MTHTAGPYPGIHSMKPQGVLLLDPPGLDSGPSQVTVPAIYILTGCFDGSPVPIYTLYSWVLLGGESLGGERHCESKVSCN